MSLLFPLCALRWSVLVLQAASQTNTLTISETPIPNGMVTRKIFPSLPTAPTMDVAKAILKGDDMDPIAVSTARAAASQVPDIPKRDAAWT